MPGLASTVIAQPPSTVIGLVVCGALVSSGCAHGLHAIDAIDSTLALLRHREQAPGTTKRFSNGRMQVANTFAVEEELDLFQAATRPQLPSDPLRCSWISGLAPPRWPRFPAQVAAGRATTLCTVGIFRVSDFFFPGGIR